jgi:hypothetical protein
VRDQRYLNTVLPEVDKLFDLGRVRYLVILGFRNSGFDSVI